ncbi:MAG: TraB/GumN family protein, partial [Candidatus Nanohaloarchaea archaeon]
RRSAGRTMITVRGTSHIASGDLDDIRAAVATRDPDVVAVELDERRLHGLMQDDRDRSVRNPFLLLLTTVQDYLGRKTGVTPGSDMLAAFEAARDHGIDVALIDQDIGETLRKVRQVPLREKVKLAGFVLLSPLVLRGAGPVDLDTVPADDTVQQLLVHLEVGFPRLYDVLVRERNDLMARRLVRLDAEYGDVLAFVGAGHVEGIQERLGDRSAA